MANVSTLGEFGLIEQFRRQAKVSSLVLKGIGDDAAVLNFPAHRKLILTTDMIVEGVHFTRKMNPESIGHKALACNISDIAAMGGTPKFAVIALGVSGRDSIKIINAIYRGIFSLARKFSVDIVGGDTVKSDKLCLNITLIGEADPKKVVLRSGAKVGDKIFVTGPLGNSLASGHHLTFCPRVKESQYLVKHFKINSMIDISDGFTADLGHILDESQVGAQLAAPMIPRRGKANLNQALNDGEDFELLFTLSAKESNRLKVSKDHSFQFYQVGEIVPKNEGMNLVDLDGHKIRLKPIGYKHF